MSKWDRIRTKLTFVGHDAWRIIRDYLYPFIYTVLIYLFTFLLFLYKNIWYLIKTNLYPAIRKLYDRIAIKKRIGLGFIVIIVLAVLVNQLIPNLNGPNQAATHSKTDRVEHEMVQKLLNGSWEEQKSAVTQVLKSSGMTVLEGDADPTSESLFIIPPELTKLTYDANHKATGGTITLEQVSKMLSDFEFPFIEGEDPALLLKSGIQKWIQAALDDPNQDGAYVPIFLDAMAKEQIPAIDLATDDWLPHEYRMTYLEFEIFLNYLYQAIPQEKQSSSLWNLFGHVAYAAEPAGSCSFAMDWLVDQGKKSGHGTLATTGVGLINILTTELTGMGISKFGDLASKTATALGSAFKVAKIGMLYWGVEITVEALPEEVHKPTSNETDKDIEYIAKVGVNEEKYQEFVAQWNATPVVREIKDCLSFAGIPLPTDTKDIAADVDKWFVEWDIVQGTGHATIGLEQNDFAYAGQLQMQVKRTGASKGESRLIVDVGYEDTKNHKGIETTVPVTTRAILEMNAPPSVLTSLNAGKQGFEAAKSGAFELLGLTDSLMDMLAGWAQEVSDPVSYYAIPVTYHEPKDPVYSYDGWIRVEQEYRRGVTTEKSKKIVSRMFEAKWQVISDFIRPDTSSEMMGNGSIEGTYDEYIWYDHSSKDCTSYEETQVSGHEKEDKLFNGIISRKGNEKKGYVYTIGNFYIHDFYVETLLDYYSNSCGKTYTQKRTIEKGAHNIIELDDLSILTTEAYPKVLQGRKRVVDENGQITIWTWRLNRIEHESEMYQRKEFQ
jgi:hypothetical protein